MSTEELTLWFNDELWPRYTDLVKTPFATKYRAGSKGEALKKILTLKPSGELQSRIISATSEQHKHRNKLYGQVGSMQKYLAATKFEKFYANRMCVTWINQMGWEDEIPALSEINEAKQHLFGKALCIKKECNYPIHGPSYTFCTKHTGRSSQSDEELSEQLKKMDLRKTKSESVHDYAMRCKAIALKYLKGLGNGMRMQQKGNDT